MAEAPLAADITAPSSEGVLHQEEAPQSSTVVFDSHRQMLEGLSREERAKHYIAEQFALGPLGDPHATSVRFSLPQAHYWHDDRKWHYLDGRIMDDNNPFNDEVVDPAENFSSPEEFTTLVNFYRSRQTPEQRATIEKHLEALTDARDRLNELITANEFEETAA